MRQFNNQNQEINYSLGFFPKTGSYEWSFHFGNIITEDSLYKSPKLLQNIEPELKAYSVDQVNSYCAIGNPESGMVDTYVNPKLLQGNDGMSMLSGIPRANEYKKSNRLTGNSQNDISRFGESIKMSSSHILVGAPQSNDSSGSAFLFRATTDGGVGTTGSIGWNQSVELSGSSPSGCFGCRCGIMEYRGINILAIGATGENEGSGAVYLYTNNGANLIKKITPEIEGSSSFGKSLVFMSAESIKYLGIGYDLSGTGKVQMHKESKLEALDFVKYRTIESLNPHSGDMFGYATDGATNSLFISSPNEFGSGAVYYHKYNDEEGFFERTQRIVPEDLSSGEYFGKNISFDNDDGVITSNRSSGKAYIYDYDEGTGWQNISSLTGTGSISGSFGGSESGSFSTSLLGNALIIGYSQEYKADYFSTGEVFSEIKTGISFSGVSGKIYDKENRFIYGYNPKELTKIHGNIFSGQYNVFVNEYLCVSAIPKENFIINGWTISGKENFNNYLLEFSNTQQYDNGFQKKTFSY
jgi:hypothetical protein